jgi:hypothetical protein
MKFYIDLATRRFLKAPNSSVPLPRVFFKRRDVVDVEVVFVERLAIVPTPAGTTLKTALKRSFSDPQFLALAETDGTLNLYTVPVEELFPGNTASASALLEVKYTRPGEETRTATLAVELQNSVILGDEGTPTAMPSLKANEAEAAAGTSNEKWTTPLRVWDAIRAWAAANFTWASLAGKPSAFPPSSHTHTASQITDLAAAMPPADWATLTGKPSTFPPATHQHTLADVSGLQTTLDAKQPAGSYATAAQGAKADSALQPSSLTPYRTATSQDAIDAGKAPANHTHTASQISDFAAAVAAVAAVSPPQAAISVTANSGITSTLNTLATAYNTTVADSVVSVSVGGAPAAPASSWKSKNLVQVLDDILFPTILASVGSAKSIQLGVSGASGVLEIGSSSARTLTATFTRGTILDGNGSTNANPLVGDPTGYTFTGTGIFSTTQPGNTLTFTTAIVSGSNNWAVTAAHAAGTGTYFDNKGVVGTNLASSRTAGTATDSTSAPTITGVHPFYHLRSSSPISAAAMVAAIENGTATKIIADSTGTLTIPYAPSAQYLAVAYPSTSTTKTRYFVTALDNGAITVVFQPVATQSVTTAFWTQSYKIHTSSGALTNSAANIELRNT